MTTKSELSEDAIEEINNVFFKLDNEGIAYAATEGYADSPVLEGLYPDYKVALTTLKKALATFETITMRIRDEHDIEES